MADLGLGVIRVVDLVLVVVAVWAALVRTPIGDLGGRAVDLARGIERDHPPLTAWFVPAPREDVVAVAQAIVLPTGPVPVGGMAPRWRAVAGRLPEDLPGLAPGLDAGARLAALDALAADVGPDGALEVAVIGRDLRDRAVARATAAGEPDAAAWAGHRRYLPDEARGRGDRVLPDLLAAAALLDVKWPIEGPHRVSSKFGMRFSPIVHRWKTHEGVDLAVPVGTPVYAAQDGVVKTVATSEMAGEHVVLDHGGGVRTSYLHLSRIDVARGATVKRGDLIALSGNTGRSTGPHLHFGLRIAGKLVDPLPLRPEPVAVAPGQPAGGR